MAPALVKQPFPIYCKNHFQNEEEKQVKYEKIQIIFRNGKIDDRGGTNLAIYF